MKAIFVPVVAVMMTVLAALSGCTDESGDDDDSKEEDMVVDDGNGGPQGDNPVDEDDDIEMWILSDESHDFTAESAHDVHLSGEVNFMLLVGNDGGNNATIELDTSEPGGWSAKTDKNPLHLGPGQNTVVILTVRPPGDVSADDTATVTVTASVMSGGTLTGLVTAHITAKDMGTVRAQVNDLVNVHYVLVDRGADEGFDNDTWAVSQTSHDSVYPFECTAGGPETIEGFSEALVGMRVGETKCLLIPSEKGYGDDPSDGKPDGDMYYEIFMVENKGQ